MTKEERRNLVDFKDPEIPVTKQAELLKINRSSLYYQPVGISPEELDLRRQIDELYTEYPYYGSRKIARHFKGQSQKSTTINAGNGYFSYLSGAKSKPAQS